MRILIFAMVLGFGFISQAKTIGMELFNQQKPVPLMHTPLSIMSENQPPNQGPIHPIPPGNVMRNLKARIEIKKIEVISMADGGFDWKNTTVCTLEREVSLYDLRDDSGAVVGPATSCVSTLDGAEVTVNLSVFAYVIKSSIFENEEPIEMSGISMNLGVYPNAYIDPGAFENRHATSSQMSRNIDNISAIGILVPNFNWHCSGGSGDAPPSCEPPFTEYFTASVEITEL